MLGAQLRVKERRILSAYFSAKSWRESLKNSDKAKLQVSIDRYRYSKPGVIEERPYQKMAVDAACKKTKGLFSLELWTGAGKSILAADISLRFLAAGKKVIFICPNRTGLGVAGDGEELKPDGIIGKFDILFRSKAPNTYQFGALNETTALNDIHFFLPHKFIELSKTSLFKRLMDEVGILIVDEAHHFPEDPEGHQVLYGKIESLAREHFLGVGKKVITLTATHGRMDGKRVFGKHEPDFKISVYDAIQMGYCPVIHGISAYIDMPAPRASVRKSDFDLGFRGKELGKYLQKVAGRMIEVQKRHPKAQFCAFVRTRREANRLVRIWNHVAKKLGFLPIVALTCDVPEGIRHQHKTGLDEKKYQGYVTCDVGSESIDIPALEIVHLIRRTKSIRKLVQSIGRALRLPVGKVRALIVDYNVQEGKIIQACKGLVDYAIFQGAKPSARRISGGPLFLIEGSLDPDLSGPELEEERPLLVKVLRRFKPLEPGEKFGRLTVLRDEGSMKVICRCECGTEKIFQRASLRWSGTKSCGCITKEKALEPGRKFTSLTVLRDEGAHHVVCRCQCGKETTGERDKIKKGIKISCGCAHRGDVLAAGTRFGKIVVLKDDGFFKIYCKCDCGKTCITDRGLLRYGTKKSCGCLKEPYGPFKKNKRVGILTVVEDQGSMKVSVVCDCGRKIIVSRHMLRKGRYCCGRCPKSRQCKCRRTGRAIQPGKRFERLVVTGDYGSADVRCICDCGKKVVATRTSLRTGDRKSCGCLFRSRWVEKLPKNVQKCLRLDGRLKVGSRFSNLTVIADKRSNKVVCRCACGTKTQTNRSALLNGRAKSCGRWCGRSPLLQKGEKYGLLTVLKDRGARKVLCLCECGRKALRCRSVLRKGNVKSCGCLRVRTGNPISRGTRFGNLVVMEDRGATQVRCRCKCGKDVVKRRVGLIHWGIRSCGCLSNKRLPKPKEGRRFGYWTVLEVNRSKHVLCICRCGKRKRVTKSHLYSGASKSCGCKQMTPAVESGHRFGRLVVLDDPRTGRKGDGKNMVLCRCDCGKERRVARHNLHGKAITSCGCRKYNPVPKGRVFGLLKVVEDRGAREVLCKCKCGGTKITLRAVLRAGTVKSCGCLSEPNGPIQPGEQFHFWTVIKDAGCLDVKCKCKCGKIRTIPRGNLRLGKTKSCGCFKSPEGSMKAGQIFGPWTVIEDRGGHEVFCRCSCGNKKSLTRYNLRNTIRETCSCRNTKKTA